MATVDHSQTARRATVPDWLRQGETRLRLQTIVRLRWLAVLGQSLTVIGAYWVLGIDLPIGGCLAIIALSAWLNVALRVRFDGFSKTSATMRCSSTRDARDTIAASPLHQVTSSTSRSRRNGS